MYGEGNERQLCVGDCFLTSNKKNADPDASDIYTEMPLNLEHDLT